MSTFDDPNREAVGQPPIWTGAGEEPPPEGRQSQARQQQAGFDPGEHTAADVVAYVEANPGERAAVLKAEKAGKNRTTLVNRLEEA